MQGPTNGRMDQLTRNWHKESLCTRLKVQKRVGKLYDQKLCASEDFQNMNTWSLALCLSKIRIYRLPPLVYASCFQSRATRL